MQMKMELPWLEIKLPFLYNSDFFANEVSSIQISMWEEKLSLLSFVFVV